MSEVFDGEVTALLGEGTSFEGKLVFEGTVRIDGEFKGEIYTRDTLIVGPGSNVQAHIVADVVIVAGRVSGEINAASRVEIQRGGHVQGSIITPVLKTEEKGALDGSVRMSQ